MSSLELSRSGMYAGTYRTDKSRQKEMNQWRPSDTVRADRVRVKALLKEHIKYFEVEVLADRNSTF